MGESSIELRVHHASTAPGSEAVAGEGSLETRLPGEGQLMLRLPYVVGQIPAVGIAQVAASYDLAKETPLVPNVAVVAHVDLPTAPGARGAQPGARLTVAKRLGGGIIETIHLESEMWTEGPTLTRSYRAAIGTTFRLRAATSGSLDLVALRPGADTGRANENLAQLGLAHQLDPDTNLRVGVAAGIAGGASPIRATFGIDHRF